MTQTIELNDSSISSLTQLVLANRLALTLLAGNQTEANHIVEDAFESGLDEDTFRDEVLGVAMNRVDDYLTAMLAGSEEQEAPLRAG